MTNTIDLENAIIGMKDVDVILKSINANASNLSPEYIERALYLINKLFDERYNALLNQFYKH